MGVSGDAQTQAAQPVGHVPIEVGVVHVGPIETGPGMLQQSWSAAQHCKPQQN
jgi:hypothetical protein